MIKTDINTCSNSYYTGPERRLAKKSRRSPVLRRHRQRTESLVSDCRIIKARRKEDEDGYIEISLDTDENSGRLHSQKPK